MRSLLIILLLVLAPGLASAAERRPAVPGDSVAALLSRLQREADPAQAEKLRERLRRAWLAQGTASARVLLAEAARAQADGLVETAGRLLDLVVKRWPDYLAGRFRRAVLLWQQGRKEAALAELNAILTRQPAHFPAAMLKLRLLEEQRDFKEALKVCRATQRQFPAWRALQRRCRGLQWRVEQDV